MCPSVARVIAKIPAPYTHTTLMREVMYFCAVHIFFTYSLSFTTYKKYAILRKKLTHDRGSIQ